MEGIDKIIEMILDEDDLQGGISAISIVDKPAIQSDFVTLSEQQKIQLAKVDEEKRILMGAALIPNLPIYRVDETGEEYYIYFSENTVRKASERYLTLGKQNNTTLQHEVILQGLTVVESWIKEDNNYDKSKKYGIDVPNGTWLVSMKVNDESIWNQYVKEGVVKGFSIEGLFSKKEVEDVDAKLLKQITKILNS